MSQINACFASQDDAAEKGQRRQVAETRTTFENFYIIKKQIEKENLKELHDKVMRKKAHKLAKALRKPSMIAIEDVH